MNREQIWENWGVRLPAYIDNTFVQINTDVITNALSLLLSKSWLKWDKIVVDFRKNKVSTLGENVHLFTTTSGHYTIKLAKQKQVIDG